MFACSMFLLYMILDCMLLIDYVVACDVLVVHVIVLYAFACLCSCD